VSFLPFAFSPIVRHVTDSQEMLETAMSFVTNQWSEWFDGYPAKPRTVLDRIDHVLKGERVEVSAD
jgi:hypothetical protein